MEPGNEQSKMTEPEQPPAPLAPAIAPSRTLSFAQRIRSQHTLYPLTLLLLPLLVLCRNSNSIFTNGFGYLDPWFYYGFFHNLALFKGRLFPGTYYGSRLSWVLPGYLVNQIFDPLLANYVLHLAVFYVAVLSLYFILARTINRPTALLTAIAFGLHPHLWTAVGWDGMDGAGIAYYLLATALLTHAAQARRPALTLALAGAACAAIVYTNLTWVIFMPFFPAYYLFRRKQHYGRGYLFDLGRFTLWAGSGAAALTILFAVINYRLDGNFWFYGPSIHFALNSVNQPSPYKTKNLHWIWGAKWLLFPALTLLGIAFAIPLARRFGKPLSAETRTAIFFAGNFLFSAALFGLAEVRGQPLMELYYYVSYLLPPAFLAFGALLLRLDARWKAPHLLLFTAAAAVLLAIPWWDLQGVVWAAVAKMGAASVICLAVVAVVSRTLLPPNGVTLWIVLLALASCSILVLKTDSTFSASGTGTEYRDGFLRITQAMNYIQKARPDRNTRFWIDDSEPQGPEFNSLSAVYLWGYVLMGHDFPSLPPGIQLPPGSLLVIPSNRRNVLELAKKTLEPRHLLPTLLSSNAIERGSVRYSLNILLLDRDPGALQPLTVLSGGELAPTAAGLPSAPLPAGKWRLPDDSGSALRTLQGLQVTTTSNQWGYSVYYDTPLAAATDGLYLFSIRYRLLRGSITFGALTENRSTWLAQASAPTPSGDVLVQECTVSLKAGQRIWLQTTNSQPQGQGSSEFVIQELRADRLKP
jgi:hypothetical protein